MPVNKAEKLFKPCSFMARYYSTQNCRGFTLIEIITVLSILGILAIIILKNASINNSDLLSFTASFKAHIRYCQSKAMQSDTLIWGLRIDAGADEYWMFSSPLNTSGNWNSNRQLSPGAESSPAVSDTQDRINAGLININIAPFRVGNMGTASQMTLVFDPMGVPYAATGKGSVSFQDSVGNTGSALPLLTKDISLNLSDGYGNTETIVIQNETGFIQ